MSHCLGHTLSPALFAILPLTLVRSMETPPSLSHFFLQLLHFCPTCTFECGGLIGTGRVRHLIGLQGDIVEIWVVFVFVATHECLLSK